MEKVRLALIGAGAMAQSVHYPSLAEMEDVELAGLCDLDRARLQDTGDRFGIEVRSQDYRTLIEQTAPDAVYILMPPHQLFDLAIHCLERKLNVFIEKPPGVTSVQARGLARAAERSGSLTMVAFNRRFIPAARAAKERVQQRGPITQCVATFYKNQLGGAPYYGGAIDVLTCDAIHAVDALRWMGGEVVCAASDIRALESDFDNSFNALLSFESGAAGALLTNWAVGKRVHTLEMHATGISAFVDTDERAVIYQDNEAVGEEIWSRDLAGSDEPHKRLGFFAENRHFIDCIRQGRLPETHFGDAVRTMELVDLIYAARMM
ncbi:MAG TPA: Gfo/Idh/MocA family oxidoreductase [Armatimonadota bacterium]|nr:Gfo/Idh/MocA family oxidoreductase [Armatimonadota bacterium]